MEYALITTDLEFIRRVDAPSKTKDGYLIVPVTREDKPVYNSNTHKLVKTNVITLDGITRGWDVVALTQEELDNIDKQRSHEVDRNKLNNWISALKAGNVNNNQAQKILAWILEEVTG